MYRIHGGFSGVHSRSADDTVHPEDEKFLVMFPSEGEAFAYARKLLPKIKPGGSVSIWEEVETEEVMSFPDRFIGMNVMKLDGEWWVSPDGVDLRTHQP